MTTERQINLDAKFESLKEKLARELFSPLTEDGFEGFDKTILHVREHYDESNKRPDPMTYIKPNGLYTETEVIADMKEAQEVYSKRQVVAEKPIQSFDRRSEKECRYRDFLADAYESAFIGMSNEFDWFGKDCRIQRSSFEDDVLAGTDCVIEFFDDDDKDSNIFSGLKIDLTTSSQYDIKVGKEKDKTNIFLDFLKNGPKARDFIKRQNTVKYFTDRSGKQHEIQPIIPIVLTTDFEEAESLIRAVEATTEEPLNTGYPKELIRDIFKTHPIQLDYINQIINQLRNLKEIINTGVRGYRAQQAENEIDVLLKKFEELAQNKKSFVNTGIRQSLNQNTSSAPATRRRRIVG
jgi:hypothetical protein